MLLSCDAPLLSAVRRRLVSMDPSPARLHSAPAMLWVVPFLLLFSGFAGADELRVLGTKLEGAVVDLTSSGVVFRTKYGSGDLVIPYRSIESIESASQFTVIYGDDGTAIGRIWSIEDGNLTIGEEEDVAESIDPTTIVEAAMGCDETWYGELRRKYRYWDGNFEIGLSYSDRTTNETDVKVGFEVERQKGPTRFLLSAQYLYGQEDPPGEGSRESDNQLTALSRFEYELTPRIFGYVSNDFENDPTEQLSLRWVAKGGPGYKIIKTPRTTLRGEVGVAYVHRNFHGSSEENDASLALGAEFQTKCFETHTLKARADYLPSIDHPGKEYVMRGSASYSIPITNYLAAKWAVTNVYDNTPDEGIERNEFTATFSLAFQF